MHTNRIGRLALAAGAIGAIALSTGAARTSETCPDDPAYTRAPTRSTTPVGARFDLHTWEGVVCQFNNISAGVTHSVQAWGQPGTRVMRTLAVSGAVFDPSGGRIYRLVGPPRVREMVDSDGADLAATAQFNAHPYPPQALSFVRPTNGQTNINFGVNMIAMASTPRGLARLALEVEIEMAADIAVVKLPRKPQAEMVGLAPNFAGRVSNFIIDPDGRVSLVFEYRIGLGGGPRPAFYQLELLDTTGAVIQSNSPPQEIVTRDAIVGTHRVHGLNLGRRELGEIRLTIITDLVSHTFELVEEDLVLLE